MPGRHALSSVRGLLSAMTMLVFMTCFETPVTCVADVPPREFIEDRDIPPRSAAMPLTVGRNGQSDGHRIVIPAKVLADLVKPGKDDNAGSASLRSIIAAIALSAAVACGLVAGGSRSRLTGRNAILLSCVFVSLTAAVALAATTALADLLPPGGGPRRPRPVPGTVRPDEEQQPRRASGKIVIEVAGDGHEVLLLIGRDGLANP